MHHRSRTRALTAGALTASLCLGGLLLAVPAQTGAAPVVPPSEFTVQDLGFTLDAPGGIAGVIQPSINSQGRAAGPSGVTPPSMAPPAPAPKMAARSKGISRRSAELQPHGVPPTVFHAHRTNAALSSIEDLGTLGGDYSDAFGINFNSNLNVAQVVGEAERANGRVVAFRYTDSRNPKMENLGALGGNNSTAWDINNTGGVTGSAEVIGNGPVVHRGGIIVQGGFFRHAFRCGGGASPTLEDLGTLEGGDQSVGYGINEAGQVCGTSDVVVTEGCGSFTQDHAFLFVPGTAMEDLGTLPGGALSEAFDINNHNPVQVVGYSTRPGDLATVEHAFLYQSTTGMLDLGVLPFSGVNGDSHANSVNDAGHVVGWSGLDITSAHAFIWRDKNGNDNPDPGEMEDLNDLIPANSGWLLQVATGINNAGQIVGVGLFNDELRAFRLTPSDSQPPQLSNPAVQPASRNALGGDFTLSVQATDDQGIATVTATVNLPGGGTQTITLARQGMTNTYSGVFTAPGNLGTTPRTYTASFAATDTGGNTTTLALPGSFSVLPDQAPVIVSAGVSPPSRDNNGGTFTVTAHVTDDVGVSSVTADVNGPNMIASFQLTLQSGTNTDGVYTGQFTAPANPGSTAQQYSVSVTAEDSDQTDVASAGSVLVLGANSADGHIQVEPHFLNFGKVKIHHSKTATITVRHVGGSPNSVLSFTAGTLNAPFEVLSPDGALGGPTINLAPGEKRDIRVRFHPQTLGCYITTLPIRTTDPAHALINVKLKGKGCRVSH
jgi:probable HAF family extracellular repeat protein